MSTTAQKVIAFRQELLEGGLPHDLVDDLVKDATSTLVMNAGLDVRRSGDTQQPSSGSLTDRYADPHLTGTD
ncbi:hypothetical protein [Streptomyces sp. MMBL 11-1]|uniref:hypothetical protein n=1 Tax=Streptomyces sp. MMBL 11-1 TaxID=3026420 RepID=UPI0023614836|nr:hypothetical protein [Streptomyces sp. MMBL 11-1]